MVGATTAVDEIYHTEHGWLQEAEEHHSLSQYLAAAVLLQHRDTGCDTAHVSLYTLVENLHARREGLEKIATEAQSPQQHQDRYDIIVVEQYLLHWRDVRV